MVYSPGSHVSKRVKSLTPVEESEVGGLESWYSRPFAALALSPNQCVDTTGPTPETIGCYCNDSYFCLFVCLFVSLYLSVCLSV